MTEAAWQRRVTDLCDLLRLRWHHETDSRRSKSGFPDLVIVGPNGLLFVELKTEKGKVSKEQAEWLHDLTAAKVETYVWRPSDWVEVHNRLCHLAGRKALPLLVQ